MKNDDTMILTGRDLARILKISERRIAELARKGVLPTSDRCHLRFSVSAIRQELKKLYSGRNFIQPVDFKRNWFRAAGAAKLAKCSTATILRWARMKILAYYAFGPHMRRFRAEDIERMLGK
jgi:hypothetical protein